VPAPLNIFRTLAHNRELRSAFMALGGHLLTAGRLPARERELVILRVGWRSGSEYEFGQHRRIGADAGLTEAEIDAIAEVGTHVFSEHDAALVALADELCGDNVVSDATWSKLAARYDDATMLELLVLAGFYRLVSGTLNSAGVPLEPEALGWPDGAVALRSSPRATS
jgi:alkylhydroperoxidase family enzyme